MDLSMHFEAKVVLRRKNVWAWVSDACAILFFAGVVAYGIMTKNGTNPIFTIWLVFLIFSVGILGAVLKRRNATHFRVSDTELSVSAEGIKIGDDYYRLSDIQYIDFLVNGHYGMRAGRVLRWSFKRARIDGMENQLLFTYNGKQRSCRFFLEDAYSMRRLEMLFREFYAKQLFFRERNRGGRTFLFQQVISRQDLERAKREEGYE
jgi:hypothetical protein